jgi:hypothetical protein
VKIREVRWDARRKAFFKRQGVQQQFLEVFGVHDPGG